jgi:hypothetical protein
VPVYVTCDTTVGCTVRAAVAQAHTRALEKQNSTIVLVGTAVY